MDIFLITSASSKPLWLIAAICILLAAILLSLLYVAYSSRNSRVEIGADHIRLVGDLWGRRIPLGDLRIADARVVDLNSEPQLAPARRTLGTGLPGYAAGWFRMRGGGKALVYLTDRQRVVYLPTTRDFVLLLSVRKPEQFLEALHARKGAG